MSDASLNVGVPLTHIYGGTTLNGRYEQNQFECRGELEIDSAMYNQVQLTRIGGPFWFDSSQVLLGSWAERPEAGQAPRPVTMNMMGGLATLNAQLVSCRPPPSTAFKRALAMPALRKLCRAKCRART